MKFCTAAIDMKYSFTNSLYHQENVVKLIIHRKHISHNSHHFKLLFIFNGIIFQEEYYESKKIKEADNN